jgi:putative transposase
MQYDPDRHHRRSVRLAGYDYAQEGAFLVTLCTRERECLFGEVVDGAMHLNALGQVAEEEWWRSADIRVEVRLGPLVVMPNHLHGVIAIVAPEGALPHGPFAHPVGVGAYEPHDNVGAHGRAPLQRDPHSLGSFVAGYKSAVTARINAMRQTAGTPVWQRGFHEHIVRSEEDWERIAAYIDANPRQWQADSENPARPW